MLKTERLYNILTYGIVDIVARIFKLSYMPVLAWVVTPEEYGKLSFFFSLTVFGIIIISFNLTNYIRHITLTRGDLISNYTSTIYLFSLAFTAILILLFFEDIYHRSIIIFSFCSATQMGAASYYLALERKKSYLGFLLIVNFSGYALPFSIIYTKELVNFIDIIKTTLHFQVVTTIGVIIYLWRQRLLRFSKFRFEYLKELLRLNTPLIMNSISGVGLIYIDRFFIEKYHGYEVLGNYTYAYNSFLVYGLLIQAAINSFIPSYYSQRNRSSHISAEGLLHIYKRYALVFFPVGVVVYCLLETFKPKDYILDPGLFSILLSGAVFQYLYSLVVNKLHYLEYTNKVLYSTLVGFGVNIIANYLLVPKYDQYGAALATVLGYLSLFYSTRYFANDL